MPALRTFYILVVTQTLSLIGSRMTSIAVAVWVFNHTGNTAPLLLTSFFNELPAMLIGSLAGVMIDRWDRRRVMMLADAGQAAGSLLLLISFFSGQFQIWHLYAVALLQGVFVTFQDPANEASVTMLVPERQRERANALRNVSFPLASSVAPVLTGFLYGIIGISGVIFIDVATFLAAVTIVYFIRIPRPRTTKEGASVRGSIWREMHGGFAYVLNRRALLLLLVYLTIINYLLNGPLGLAVAYLITITGSEAVMGTLMGISSLGAFAGAALMTVWGGTRPRIHTLLLGMLLCGVMFLPFALAETPLLLGAAFFLIMLPLPASNIIVVSIMQVKIPPDMQGRVFALSGQLQYVGATISFLTIGPLVDHVLEPAVGAPAWSVFAPLVGSAPGAGMRLLLVVTGIIILALTLAIYALPMIRHMEARLPDYAALAEG